LASSTVIELLRKTGVLDARQHDTVLVRAKTSSGGTLVQRVAELGFATESTVGRALSVELGLPRIDLHITPPEPEALALLDGQICQEKFVLPIALREGGELLWLAMGDPTDSATMALVRKRTGKRVRPVVAGPTEIAREARRIYGNAAHRSEVQFEQNPDDVAFDEEGVEVEETFEIVNVSDASALPAHAGIHAVAPVEARPSMVRAQPATPLDFDSLFAIRPRSPFMPQNDLKPEDVLTIEAVRLSMEKAALVLRALAELCVEKKVFTQDEMRKKSR